MRCLVIVCLLSGIASADRVVTQGKVDDWTLFETERRTERGMVKERAIAIVAPSSALGVVRLAWFVGAKDNELFWRADDVRGHVTFVGIEPTKREKATCKVGSSFACTKLTYSGEMWPQEPGVVTATMSQRVRGSGIVDLEVRVGKDLQWRIKVIGYGRGAKSEWGAPRPTTKLDVPPEPERIAIVGIGGTPPQLDLGVDGPMSMAPNIGRFVGLEVKGELDAALVRRVLKLNMQKLVHCYEKEQRKNAALVGKVEVAFAIDGAGKVPTASATGFKEVEACVASMIKSIEFPRSKNQTMVTVKLSIYYTMPPVFTPLT